MSDDQTNRYTVVGVYDDTGDGYQRFASHVRAHSPAEAEAGTLAEGSWDGTDMIVAAVFPGWIDAIDDATYSHPGEPGVCPHGRR